MSKDEFNGVDESVLKDWLDSIPEKDKNDVNDQPMTDSQIQELEADLKEAKEQLKLLQAKCELLEYLLNEAKRLKSQ